MDETISRRRVNEARLCENCEMDRRGKSFECGDDSELGRDVEGL